MKRSTSAERETPKKRRKSRGPRTTSPSSRHRMPKPLSMKEARASSELFQKAIQSRKIEPRKEPLPAANAAALEPAAPLLETSPASSPLENLESVVHKIPSSGPADMDMIDEDDAAEEALCENFSTAHDATPKRKRDKEERRKADDKEGLANTDESAPEKETGKDEAETQAMHVEIAAAKSPQLKTELDQTQADGIEIVATPGQGRGASADDAMELDPSPSEQLEQEHQIGQDAASSCQDPPDQPGSVVSSVWLLEKLNGLTPDKLASGRAAIVQELHDMEAVIKQLPRAEMPPHPAPAAVSSNNSVQRLHMIETLIEPQLAKLPLYTWRSYKAKLLRLCAGQAIHNMDYRQRLEKVKEIIYLPEEMELVRGRGDAARIGCAVRVCATVTEILGRDDEIVPEEMAAWVAAQLKDVAWKAKVSSAWRKYWPEAHAMVVD